MTRTSKKDKPFSATKKLEKLLANTGDMALKRRAKLIIKNLNPKNGDKIIDIGCGDGYYLHLLDNLGLNLKLAGTDYDQTGLDRAAKNLNKKIKLQAADLMKKTSYPSEGFDKAVMSEVAEHLPNDVKGLKEVYRILKPGGVLCLTVPNANYPLLWDPVNWVLERVANRHIESGFWAGIWNQHIRLYRRSEIVKAVEKAGFKVETAQSTTFWSLPFNHYLVNLVARFIAQNRDNQDLVQQFNKFAKQPKQSPVMKFLFDVVNEIDKLNDYYQPTDSGVGVFVKAIKPA